MFRCWLSLRTNAECSLQGGYRIGSLLKLSLKSTAGLPQWIFGARNVCTSSGNISRPFRVAVQATSEMEVFDPPGGLPRHPVPQFVATWARRGLTISPGPVFRPESFLDGPEQASKQASKKAMHPEGRVGWTARTLVAPAVGR